MSKNYSICSLCYESGAPCTPVTNSSTIVSYLQADISNGATRIFNILARLPVVEAAVQKIRDLELTDILIRLCTSEEHKQTQDKRIDAQDEQIRFLRECIQTQALEIQALRQMVETGNDGRNTPQDS